MFTGIVETVGTVESITTHGAAAQMVIAAPGWGGDLQHGESISVNGVCLTVAAHQGDSWTADLMRVTLDTTTLGDLSAGDRVNLERATRASDRLGGHIVQGHADGHATLVARDSQDDWDDFSFDVAPEIAKYIVSKGSIALAGVSLTVAALDGARVTVSLIPTTLAETILGSLEVGQRVNVEVDVIAKYVESLLGARA